MVNVRPIRNMMNRSEEFFRAVARDAEYFFVDLPREAADKAKYHVGLLATFLGGVWIFVQAVETLGLQSWLPGTLIMVAILALMSLLVLVSLLLAFVALLFETHFTPDYEKLLAQYKKEAGPHSEFSIDSEFGSHWIDKMLLATKKNHAIHEKKMRVLKGSHYVFMGALGFSALIPILMLIKSLGGAHG